MIKTLPGLIFDFVTSTKHTPFAHIFYIEKHVPSLIL